VLLPLALAGGHQGDNARAHVRAGAGMAAFGDPPPGDLATLIADLLRSPERLESMARAARGLARPNAASHIVDRIVALTTGPAAGGQGRSGGRT
ncbi:MAG: hypothetical protein ACRD2Z_13505, partial [Thermoanaerobaculia bacterium]